MGKFVDIELGDDKVQGTIKGALSGCRRDLHKDSRVPVKNLFGGKKEPCQGKQTCHEGNF